MAIYRIFDAMNSRPGWNVRLLAIGALLVAAIAGIPSLRAAVLDAGAGLFANEIARFIVGSFLVFIAAAVLVNFVIGKVKDFGTIDLHNSVWIWR